MNRKQILTIVCIVAFSGVTSLVYGVTNGTIIVGDLTVTGTCTGCSSGGEGNYNSWSLLTNTTVTGVDAARVTNVLVNNDGSVLTENVDCVDEYIFVNGTLITTTLSHSNCFQSQTSISQSSQTGKYQVILDEDRSNNVYVYKNNVLKDTKTIQKTQFVSNNLGSVASSISPNGKYIAIYGTDNGATDQRLIVLSGS